MRLLPVKYKFDSKASVIVLEVEIRQKVAVKSRLAFDTGATYTMISWEIAETLGLKPELARESVDIITASGVEKSPLVNLKSVSFLAKLAGDVEAVVHNLPAQSFVDGLLGLSFLKNFKFCVDFKKGVLELM